MSETACCQIAESNFKRKCKPKQNKFSGWNIECSIFEISSMTQHHEFVEIDNWLIAYWQIQVVLSAVHYF